MFYVIHVTGSRTWSELRHQLSSARRHGRRELQVRYAYLSDLLIFAQFMFITFLELKVFVLLINCLCLFVTCVDPCFDPSSRK